MSSIPELSWTVCDVLYETMGSRLEDSTVAAKSSLYSSKPTLYCGWLTDDQEARVRVAASDVSRSKNIRLRDGVLTSASKACLLSWLSNDTTTGNIMLGLSKQEHVCCVFVRRVR